MNYNFTAINPFKHVFKPFEKFAKVIIVPMISDKKC